MPRQPRRWPILAALLLSASPAAAQSGTWVGTPAGAAVANTWSSPSNWQGGSIPDVGGTATFNNLTGQLGSFTATIDTTLRTLGGITYDTGYSVTVAATGGTTLNVAAGGLTLNAVTSQTSTPTSFFTAVNSISAVIAGSGDLIKTGPGSVALAAAAVNTFTGTVRVNQGSLNALGGNTSLGNAANAVVLDGGILGVSTNALTTDRTLTIGGNGGTIRTFQTTTFGTSSVVNGSGTLIKQIGGTTQNLLLQGDMTAFTGGLRVEGGFIILTGTALGGSSGADVAGALQIDNSVSNVTNRLNGRAVTVRGGSVFLAGNASAASTETTGVLTIAQGTALVTVVPNAAQAATLTFPSLVRQNNAIAYIRSPGLGTAPAAGVGNVAFTTSPGTLVGGAGDPTNTTTASILPFAIGNTSTTTLNDATFVTWDSASNRIVPVSVSTGYATNILTATALDNVNQNASATLTGATAVNALRLAPATAVTIDGLAQLMVTSGAILQTSSAATTPAVTISAPVTAGPRELVLISTSGISSSPTLAPTGLILSNTVSGTGGLTVSGYGGVTLTGANMYTGPTTFNGSTTVLGGPALTLTADGSVPSVLGQDTSAITLASAGTTNRVWTTGNLVVNRPLNVILGGAGTTGIGTVGVTVNESVTINAAVTLTNPTGSTTNNFFNLEGSPFRSGAVTANAVISGNGGLRGTSGGYSILNAANTFSGGVILGGSGFILGTGVTAQLTTETWEAGNDAAFGTGTLFVLAVSGSTTPVSGSATLVAGGGPRTLANPVVLSAGLMTTGGSNPLTLVGPVELNGGTNTNAVVTVGATAPLTISGAVARGGLIKNGPGTLTLTNATNPYSGQTIVRQGVLSVGAIGNGGVAGNLGQGLSAATYVFLSGNAVGDTGVLLYTGAGETTNRLFSLAGTGGTLDASGSGPLVFGATGTASMTTPPTNLGGAAINITTGAITISTTINSQLVVGSVLSGNANIQAGTTITEVGVNYIRLSLPTTNAAALTGQTFTVTLPGSVVSRTLTLTGTNGGANILTPVLANGGGLTLAVAKTGPGTWVLAGNNTYSAGTVLSAGTLRVNGQTGTNSGTGNGPVTVNGGTFAGSGRASGAVTVNDTGTLQGGTGGAATAANTLSLGGTLTTDGGVTLRTVFADTNLGNAAADPTASLIAVTGAFDKNPGGAADLITVRLVGANGTYDFGQTYTITIATFANAGTLGLGDFAIGAPEGFTYEGTPLLSLTGTQLQLTFVPTPEPGTVIGLSAVLLAGGGWIARRRRADGVALVASAG